MNRRMIMVWRPCLLTVAGSRAFSRSRRRPTARMLIQRQAGTARDPPRPAANQSGNSDPNENQISMLNKVLALMSCVTCGAAIWSFGENKCALNLRLPVRRSVSASFIEWLAPFEACQPQASSTGDRLWQVVVYCVSHGIS